MPVFKNKTQGEYVNVYKDILKNHSLSLRDRGMVVTLLSLPDNWEFTISGLSKSIPDGKSSIRASLTHSEELGYISRTQERAECGKFGKIVIEIHETPIAPLADFRQTEKPKADNPVAGKPASEKRTQYINNQLNNNQVNNHPSINHSDESEGEKDTEQLRKFVAENIKLEQFYEVAEGNAREQEMIREIYDTICDVVCFPRKQITIKGTSYPGRVVKSQFLKLKPLHIANLLERLVDNSLEIKNMESYLIFMSASKDTKRGTWKVYIRYKDWQGVGQVHTKRGFATKREALEYEREFLLKKSKDVNMGFPQFVDVYMEDMKPRLKLNTFLTKKHIMDSKIIPYFEKKSLAEITATDVIQWQNQLLSMRDENGMPYSQTYLRTIQNQLSAIFNHACRFYGLTANPSK